jgi:hypothetical protein
MKTILYLFTLLFINSAVVFAQPKIEIVGGETLDFGAIYKGDKIDRKVTIKNVGTETLVIERVQPSCGCTATLLEEKNIPPGKTTSLSIGFDSKNFTGVVHKSVTVFSNDPTFASKEIRFQASIQEALTVSPPYIFFMPGKVDSTMTSTTTLKNTSDETIKSVSSTVGEMKFDIKKKSLAPGETTPLTAAFTPTKIGYVNGDIVITTSHPRQKELTIKFGCNVLRAATPSAPKGSFQSGKEGFPTTERNK